MLRDVTISHILDDTRGREALAVHEIVGVLASTARRLDEAERAVLARSLALAAEMDPDFAPLLLGH